MCSSSASHTTWPQYGPVPMRRCNDCARPDPLKRFVSKTDENGNLGRHFVKCLSKPMVGPDGKMLKKCSHFEWMDEYIERLEFEGDIDFIGGATEYLILPPLAMPTSRNLNFSSDGGADRAVPTARNARNAELPAGPELKEELKKINRHLNQMVDLQKQANLMAGGFYAFIVALCFCYLLSR